MKIDQIRIQCISQDGTICRSYCSTCSSDEDYWNSLDSSDQIPRIHSYTFDGNTLLWDGTQRTVTFECNGVKVEFSSGKNLLKLNSACQ